MIRMSDMEHRSAEELEAGFDDILQSPRDVGTLELIVCRPQVDEREILEVGQLNAEIGLVGDNWRVRGSSSRPDRSANPNAQLTMMNSRAAALVAGPKQRWALAGDQLFLDLDLSDDHLPAGTRLSLGSAVIEITEDPHRGCAKFAARFGNAALRFVNTGVGMTLNLRGRHARVVTSGEVKRGDPVRVLGESG